MKEASVGGAAEERARRATEKEKTKLRERQRRSITTKIFNGLRKHGNYDLAPRADINDVLRALAGEAGWIVEADGTTYRAKKDRQLHPPQHCPTCIVSGNSSRTTASSLGGECSTTASPRHVSLQQPSSSSSGGPTAFAGPYLAPASDVSLTRLREDELKAYFQGGGHVDGVGYGLAGGPYSMLPRQQQQQHAFFMEARASNQNTPIGSPQHHV
ncbi:BES1/BZR1 homolog protein 4-like [Magnolia sinica]|uniref:BES1/BZR1 homolog protein 4-like n=1 Tax=Magnolia sinica TaxID=86752 RepID=UPI002659BBCB|nr:BES1/BZR1 homolog protein 4-like [Magnolia sinica]